MPYKVTVSAEVVSLAGGIRRRCGLTFSRLPVFLDRLPRGIKDDPHLIVEELTDEAFAALRGRTTPLPGDSVAVPDKYRALQALARRWQLPDGRKEELAERVRERAVLLIERGRKGEVDRAIAAAESEAGGG